LKKPLTTSESLYLSGQHWTIFASFFLKDLKHLFTSFHNLLPHTLFLLEYLVLTIIVIISGFWLFSSLWSSESDILSYLPIFGFLGLLLYIYNQCSFKRPLYQIGAFLVLLIVYFYGIILLKSTFAF
jgi:hypothetical protein